MKFFFSNGSASIGQVQAGAVKAIAHTGKGRLRTLPDLPPVSDTIPGFEAYEWNGVFVPTGTPVWTTTGAGAVGAGKSGPAQAGQPASRIGAATPAATAARRSSRSPGRAALCPLWPVSVRVMVTSP